MSQSLGMVSLMWPKGIGSYDRDRVARLFDRPATARSARRRLVAAEGTLPHDADDLAFERLELCRKDVLLDVGTGDGRMAVRAARICRRVIGIDISRKSLERARERAAHEALRNVSFAYGAFEDPCAESDLTSCGVNKILAAYSLHHLSDRFKEKSLGVLASLLQRPGRIAIGDLMFSEDPAGHEDEWSNVAYDGGEYDFPASVDMLKDALQRLGATVRVDRLHPLVGVITADFAPRMAGRENPKHPSTTLGAGRTSETRNSKLETKPKIQCS